MAKKRSEREAGFTLIELLIILIVIGIIAAIGYPSLQKMIIRSNLEGVTRGTAVLMQSCRIEAMKQNRPCRVLADTAKRDVVAWVDMNTDGVQDADEPLIGQVRLHATVSFVAPGAELIFESFDTAGTTGWATFLGDGTVEKVGAIRFGDTRDNFLEVRVQPQATGRIQTRKYNDTIPVNDDGTNWYGPGEGGVAWEWSS